MAEDWLGDSPFVSQRRVKWGECDPAGVVYTPRFTDYVVEAFQDFLEHLLGPQLQDRLAELNLGTPAKALQIVFQKSLWPGDVVFLTVRGGAIRRRSFDVAIDATDSNGNELFSASFSAVCVYHERREGRHIPGLLRRRLEHYREHFPAREPATVAGRLPGTGDVTQSVGEGAL